MEPWVELLTGAQRAAHSDGMAISDETGGHPQLDGGERAVAPNRLIALNLVEARRSRGWTQARAAEELSKHGAPWSKQLVSNTEKAASEHEDTRRGARTVTPDDLVAMSGAFGRPIAWWFLPPANIERTTPIGPVGGEHAATPAEYLRTLFDGWPELHERVTTSLPVDDEIAITARDFIRHAVLDRLKQHGAATRDEERQRWDDVTRALEEFSALAGQMRDAVPDDPLAWMQTPEAQEKARRGRERYEQDAAAREAEAEQ